jgi:hypothetical protein
MEMMVSIDITGDFNSDEALEWVMANCPSFEKYKVVELGWEEKMEKNCWFEFHVYFTDERDATLFALKWA